MDIEPEVDKLVDKINHEVKSRAHRASEELRNSALVILRGQRSGRVYKKPGTYGKRMNKTTEKLLGEYGHKLRGGQLYQASASGEAPAVRSGDLRRSWRTKTASVETGGRLTVKAAITTNVKYAPWLHKGTDRMAPRPYEEPIIAKAMPKIKRIYLDPYLK